MHSLRYFYNKEMKDLMDTKPYDIVETYLKLISVFLCKCRSKTPVYHRNVESMCTLGKHPITPC